MTDGKTQPTPNDRPQQARPEQSDREAQQDEIAAPAESGQRAVPGRRPLFRS
jgi:hypothetical protein